jgi:hypothetical protein
MWIRIRDPGSGIFLTLNPGSGMEIFGCGIRDKHPGSATMLAGYGFALFIRIEKVCFIN